MSKSLYFTSPDKEKTVMELLRERGINISAPCGGFGSCGKCKIKLEGELSPPTEIEKTRLTESEIKNGVRLACRVYPEGDFIAYLSESVGFSVLTDNYLNEKPVGTPVAPGWGIGVDIGTTTVAVYLCSMEEGTAVDVKSFVNPQTSYGADVISRLSYIREQENGLQTLQKQIITAIDEAVKSFEKEIGYLAFAGNTVMQHIAAGIDPSGIAVAPFTPTTLFGYELNSEDIGLCCNNVPVWFMPCAASYVGGDILSGLCACGADTADGLTLYLDIGTNGEIALGDKNGFMTCAAAAGPAFEGAGIECGSAGVDGAINKIKLENGKAAFETIGGLPPVGICGSALIDLTAELLRNGIVDETGFMEENFDLTDDGRLYLSPKDIRQLQLAKAAIAAGIDTLLIKTGKKESDVDRVILAGGFGSFIDRKSAALIGLIPSSLESKITAVGNASGAGAVKWLIDSYFRESLNALNEKTGYIELSADPVFSERFMERMFFE
ncbi:MAG: ASKHA domain-containing protein [Eubacteriales bacterium]|jgi:uncharacterized 2Fe-2S/4Fe-4S cluster protein (DUF4445 family)